MSFLHWGSSSPTFVPDIPHPIRDVHGEKGAGKSIHERVLRRLIDPSGLETLTFPRNTEALAQILSHHYAPIFDNVDNIPPWLSDMLCRAVTGDGSSKRRLYSDDEDINLQLQAGHHAQRHQRRGAATRPLREKQSSTA